jgi:hypothetical protein
MACSSGTQCLREMMDHFAAQPLWNEQHSLPRSTVTSSTSHRSQNRQHASDTRSSGPQLPGSAVSNRLVTSVSFSSSSSSSSSSSCLFVCCLLAHCLFFGSPYLLFCFVILQSPPPAATTTTPPAVVSIPAQHNQRWVCCVRWWWRRGGRWLGRELTGLSVAANRPALLVLKSIRLAIHHACSALLSTTTTAAAFRASSFTAEESTNATTTPGSPEYTLALSSLICFGSTPTNSVRPGPVRRAQRSPHAVRLGSCSGILHFLCLLACGIDVRVVYLPLPRAH